MKNAVNQKNRTAAETTLIQNAIADSKQKLSDYLSDKLGNGFIRIYAANLKPVNQSIPMNKIPAQ